jgi:hypothetical protein
VGKEIVLYGCSIHQNKIEAIGEPTWKKKKKTSSQSMPVTSICVHHPYQFYTETMSFSNTHIGAVHMNAFIRYIIDNAFIRYIIDNNNHGRRRSCRAGKAVLGCPGLVPPRGGDTPSNTTTFLGDNW